VRIWSAAILIIEEISVGVGQLGMEGRALRSTSKPATAACVPLPGIRNSFSTSGNSYQVEILAGQVFSAI